jgi:hypothetical protein
VRSSLSLCIPSVVLCHDLQFSLAICSNVSSVAHGHPPLSSSSSTCNCRWCLGPRFCDRSWTGWRRWPRETRRTAVVCSDATMLLPCTTRCATAHWSVSLRSTRQATCPLATSTVRGVVTAGCTRSRTQRGVSRSSASAAGRGALATFATCR